MVSLVHWLVNLGYCNIIGTTYELWTLTHGFICVLAIELEDTVILQTLTTDHGPHTPFHSCFGPRTSGYFNITNAASQPWTSCMVSHIDPNLRLL